MRDSNRSIYWREDTQSFLPQFEEDSVRRVIEQELSRHTDGVENESIVLNDPNRYKTGEILDEIDSLELLDDRLRKLCGAWLPEAVSFSFDILKRRYHWDFPVFSMGLLYPDDISEAYKRALYRHLCSRYSKDRHREYCDVLIDALKGRHEKIDCILFKTHKQYPVRRAPSDAAFPQEVSAAIHSLVNDEMCKMDSYRVWYDGLCELVAIYLKSLGCRVELRKVMAAAEKNFEDWISPTDIEIKGYSDELAELAVRHYSSEGENSIIP